jgi:hypothetical protein
MAAAATSTAYALYLVRAVIEPYGLPIAALLFAGGGAALWWDMTTLRRTELLARKRQAITTTERDELEREEGYPDDE